MITLLCFSLLALDLPAPLARVLADYEKAWTAKDAKALAALFDDQGFVLASGNPPVRGRAAIEKFYQGQGGPLFLTALDYSAERSTGFILGTYRHKPDDPPAGKFTLTLVKRNGRWMIRSDMDNSSQRR